jgi:hypothetical protein
VWEMPHGLEVEGHKVWVVPCGLEVQGQNVCVLPHGLGGLEDLKAKASWGPSAFGCAFWAVGGRVASNLWPMSYRTMAK